MDRWYAFLVGRYIGPDVLAAEYDDTVANWGVIGVSLSRAGAVRMARAGDFLMIIPLDEHARAGLGESYQVEPITEDGDLS
jgi:hypothetical protein